MNGIPSDPNELAEDDITIITPKPQNPSHMKYYIRGTRAPSFEKTVLDGRLKKKCVGLRCPGIFEKRERVGPPFAFNSKKAEINFIIKNKNN